MKPSHYERLYGRRRWIYWCLLIALMVAGGGVWWQLGNPRTPSIVEPGVPAITEESPQEAAPRSQPKPPPQRASPSNRLRPAPFVPGEADDQRVLVRRGYCLWRLAERHCGSGFRWPEIYQANRPPIIDPDLIHPGQRFRIPCGK